ncbi:M-phase phosphoprotein 6, partial [Biomphalaria glabrata]
MATKRSSAQLSKNVLQMKFMQRSALRIEQEQNEENLQKIIDDEHWALDLPDYKTK